jgi:hypothetical protein
MKDRISQLLDESASHARARLDQSLPHATAMPAALSRAIHRRRRNIIITRVSVTLAALLCVGTVLVLSLPSMKGATAPNLGTTKIISQGQTQPSGVEVVTVEVQKPAHVQANPTLSRLTKTLGRQGIDSAIELLPGSTAQGDGTKPYSPRSTLPEYGEGF